MLPESHRLHRAKLCRQLRTKRTFRLRIVVLGGRMRKEDRSRKGGPSYSLATGGSSRCPSQSTAIRRRSMSTNHAPSAFENSIPRQSSELARSSGSAGDYAESPRRGLSRRSQAHECGHERADDPSCATGQLVPLEGPSGVRPAGKGQATDDGQLTTGSAALSPNPESLTPAFRRARVNGFRINANVPGIEVWMEPQISVRRKL